MQNQRVAADYSFTTNSPVTMSIFHFQHALAKTGLHKITWPDENDRTVIKGESRYGRRRVSLVITLSRADTYTARAVIHGKTKGADDEPAKKCIGRLIRVFEILEKNDPNEIVNLTSTSNRKLKTGFSRAGLLFYIITGMPGTGRKDIV